MQSVGGLGINSSQKKSQKPCFEDLPGTPAWPPWHVGCYASTNLLRGSCPGEPLGISQEISKESPGLGMGHPSQIFSCGPSERIHVEPGPRNDFFSWSDTSAPWLQVALLEATLQGGDLSMGIFFQMQLPGIFTPPADTGHPPLLSDNSLG